MLLFLSPGFRVYLSHIVGKLNNPKNGGNLFILGAYNELFLSTVIQNNIFCPLHHRFSRSLPRDFVKTHKYRNSLNAVNKLLNCTQNIF